MPRKQHIYVPYTNPTMTTRCTKCEWRIRGDRSLYGPAKRAAYRALPRFPVEARCLCGCNTFQATCPTCGYLQEWGYL